jgi:hypothetical protein
VSPRLQFPPGGELELAYIEGSVPPEVQSIQNRLAAVDGHIR